MTKNKYISYYISYYTSYYIFHFYKSSKKNIFISRNMGKLLEFSLIILAVLVFVIGLYWIIYVVHLVIKWNFSPVKEPEKSMYENSVADTF